MNRRPRKLRLAACLALVLSAAGGGAAVAGHPLGTEDAGTLGRGNAQLELNVERAQGSAGSRQTTYGGTLTVGVAPRVDLAVGGGYILLKPDAGTGTSRGAGDTDVTLKWAPIEGKGWVPTLGLKVGVTLPTGDEGKGLGHGRACGLYTVIADWEMGKLLVHANAGNTFVERPVGSHDRDDRAHAALAAEYALSDRWTAVGEYLWDKNIGQSGPASSELTLGGKLALPGDVALDAGVRWGTTEASANVTYLAGVTIGFGGSKAEGNAPPEPAHPAP